MLVSIKECGDGCNLDLLPSELLPGQWSGGSNVRFKDKFAEKRGGIQSAYTTPTGIPYWLGTYITTAGRFLIEAQLASVFVDDGTTRTDITGTPTTGGIDDRVSGGVLNGVYIYNNGVDDAQYWNGNVATNLATLTGWTAGWKSDVIRPFKNFLVALGNTRGSTKQIHNVGWSSSAAPGAIPISWTASASNDAGDVDLAETPGEMVDCLPWADSNIIYTTDARYAQQYIGGNDVFRFVRLPGSDGCLARGCIANTPKGQVFLSNGDVRIHQGGDSVSIAEGKIRRWLFRTMDTANAQRSFVVVNAQKNEVWVCFPSYGQAACDMAIAWNWDQETWSTPFTLPNVTYGTTGLVAANLSAGTWDTDPDTWESDPTTWTENEYSQNEQRLILSTTAPDIGLADTGTQDLGVRVSAYLEKVGISLDDPDSIKNIGATRWQFDAIDGIVMEIQHGSSKTADGAVSYTDAVDFTVGTSNWANKIATGGRFVAVKMTTTGDQPFALRSYDMDIKKRGRF